jgi:hypothetical protein
MSRGQNTMLIYRPSTDRAFTTSFTLKYQALSLNTTISQRLYIPARIAAPRNIAKEI